MYIYIYMYIYILINVVTRKMMLHRQVIGLPYLKTNHSPMQKRPSPEGPTAARTTRASAVLVTWLHSSAGSYVCAKMYT